MTDRKGVPDTNEPPEDVASLYSWANLHGAKYRDFSAARAQSREAQSREQSRQREKPPNEKEIERAPQPPEKRRVDERRVEEGRRIVEAKRSEEQENLAELANQLAAQLAGQQAAELAAQQGGPRPPRPDSFPAPSSYPTPPSGYPAYPTPRTTRPVPASAPLRTDIPAPTHYPELRTTGEPRDVAARPAWLAENPDPIPPQNVPRTPDDTLQGSRDRLTSRWYALKAVFEGAATSPIAETAPVPTSVRPPAVAVFSLAGGVGKTSLVATLGRALSARGERVLLVDTAAFGLLPFFFGARDQRPGLLRTFNPPLASADSPIQLIAIDPESLGTDIAALDALGNEILKHSQGVSRIIVDLATASGATTRRILKLSPLVLVPMIPDMNSVVSVARSMPSSSTTWAPPEAASVLCPEPVRSIAAAAPRRS